MATWHIGYNDYDDGTPFQDQRWPYWTERSGKRKSWHTAEDAYEYIYDNVEVGDTLHGPIDLMSAFHAGPGSYIARRCEQKPLQE
ncbi:hypothetical protein [Mycobacteroides abscessus]|uniref:hypothetical protein n=1 Tax=Mycobacteroides abscessus TaxID=36809 RepID=UPI000C258D34|nr:hypothetical protein [Mycobacteroides abscessus]PVB24446.1 hypothetical protein DDJ71_06255 [Mycobacteroides abscessus]